MENIINSFSISSSKGSSASIDGWSLQLGMKGGGGGGEGKEEEEKQFRG